MFSQILAVVLFLVVWAHANDLKKEIKVMKVTLPGKTQETRIYGKGMIVMDTEIKGHAGKMRELSDGKQILHMNFNGQEELIDCTLEVEAPRVEAFMKHVLGQEYESVEQDVDLKELADQVQSQSSKHEVEILKDLNLEEIQQFSKVLDMPTQMSMCSKLQHFYRNGTSLRRFSRSLIFPGTNWCGVGSKAEDLGEEIDTDKCCREHDHCPYFIESMKEKYNYFNFLFYTISHCDCDEKFYTCLKNTNSSSSIAIGKIYFNLLKTSCFVLVPSRVCAQHRWYGRCEHYVNQDKAAVRKPIPF